MCPGVRTPGIRRAVVDVRRGVPTPASEGARPVQGNVRLLRRGEQLPGRPVHPQPVNLPPEPILPVAQRHRVQGVPRGGVDRTVVRAGRQREPHPVRRTRRVPVQGVDNRVRGLPRHRVTREGRPDPGVNGTRAEESPARRPGELLRLPEMQHPRTRHVRGVEPAAVLVRDLSNHPVEHRVVGVLRDVPEVDSGDGAGVRRGHPLHGEVTPEIDVDLQRGAQQGVPVAEQRVPVVPGDRHANRTVRRARFNPEVHRDAVHKLVEVDVMSARLTPGERRIPVQVHQEIGGPGYHRPLVGLPSSGVGAVLNGHRLTLPLDEIGYLATNRYYVSTAMAPL